MNEYQNINQRIRALFNSLPGSMQQRIRNESYIKTVHEQFQQIIDDALLSYVNSVYLLNDDSYEQKDRKDNKQCDKNYGNSLFPAAKKLVVYVENSVCAAEMNARRELYVLKYREQFNIDITAFEIRISKAAYKNKHPFLNDKKTKQQELRVITQKEYNHINDLVARIPNKELQQSFKKVLIAQKQRDLKNN